jgi:hypothetical protein
MRLHRFLFLLFTLAAVSPPLFAQSKSSGAITSSQCVSIDVTAASTVGIQVTGTWSGTLQPEISIQGQAAANIQVTPSTSSTAQSTITANGVYTARVGGGSTFLLCGNTVSSGTANIYLNSTTAVSLNGLGGGGSGSGTVSANNGSAGAVANYAAAGGSTTVGPVTGVGSPSAGELDLGTNGGAGGIIGWNGATSGKATCTAPAVAGTSTNQLTCTNVFGGPNGALATPTYSFSGVVNSGMYLCGTATNGNCFSVAGNGALGISAEGGAARIGAASNWTFAWSNTTNVADTASGNFDTGMSRSAAGVVAVGTSATAGNEAGLFRSGDACRVTADITLPVNTATTVCSWSLPAVAKAWAWQCQIPWVISAGSGTNTLAIIANPSQTPTGTTNGTASIWTTNANNSSQTGSTLTTAISASGATTLLTSTTITPGATVLTSSTSGTLLASATAGTFAIQMTAAGTTATAAAKAGATCFLY